jgi:hypothetical protein
VAVIGGALAVGTFLATAIGTRLQIRRPTALQSSGLTITAGVAVLATIFFTLPMVALLCLVAAIFSGISKLAIDASIQERVPERLRASAFAHSETVLMMAWVVGGAVGIIPLDGRLGVGLAALFAVAAAVRAGIVATRLHGERLHGRPDTPAEDAARGTPGTAGGPGGPPGSGTAGRSRATGDTAGPPGSTRGTAGGGSPMPADPWPDAPTVAPTSGGTAPPPSAPHRPPARSGADRAPGGWTGPDQTDADRTNADRTGGDQTTVQQAAARDKLDPTLVEPPARKRFFGRRRKAEPAAPPPPAAAPPPAPEEPPAREPDPALAPPGYHIYRPTKTPGSTGDGQDPR